MLQYHLEMCVYSSKFLDKGLLNEKVKPLLLFDNMGRLYHLSLNNNVESAFFRIASEIMCFQDLGLCQLGENGALMFLSICPCIYGLLAFFC